MGPATVLSRSVLAKEKGETRFKGRLLSLCQGGRNRDTVQLMGRG